MTSREVGSGGVIPGIGGVAAATRPAAGRPAPPLVGPCAYEQRNLAEGSGVQDVLRQLHTALERLTLGSLPPGRFQP
jgi:hypothetical protein